MLKSGTGGDLCRPDALAAHARATRRAGLRGLIARWACTWPPARIASTLDAIQAARIGRDAPAAKAAADALGEAIAAGLERREGRHLLPEVLLPVGDPALTAADWIAYVALTGAREAAWPGEPAPGPLRVCEACQVVFRPARKAAGTVRWCSGCSALPASRRPTLPLGANPGWRAEPIRLRVRTGPVAGQLVTVHARECRTCGQGFLARRSTAAYCDDCRR